MKQSAHLEEQVLAALRTGIASSRSELARHLGLAPSTITGVTRRLITDGLITEGPRQESTGGRPAENLIVISAPLVWAVVELGARHARIGIGKAGSLLEATKEIGLDLKGGPTEVFQTLLPELHSLAAETRQSINGIGIAIPGPVAVDTGTITAPARMPGWNGIQLPRLLSTQTGLPVFVENDARAGSIGEFAYRQAQANPSPPSTYIYVKAGSAIGGAYILNGEMWRGATGLAGDITHVRIAHSNPAPCLCGNTGCLDTLASGAALLEQFRDRHLDFTSNHDIVQAANAGSALVTGTVRQAGEYLGQALAPLVNFLNPQAVWIGGSLSAIDAFLAGVNLSLHARCLPPIMRGLDVSAAAARADAALWGLLSLATAPIINTTAVAKSAPERTP